MQSCQLRRREFITLLGGVAAWPLGAHAQQPAKPVIGFLSGRSSEESRYLVAAFNDGLRGEDFIEGQNVMIEYRWAEGQNERLPAQAIDLARRQVAVIVAVGGDPSTHAAKAATTRIPIACVFGTDPVQTDLVASLNRPGGNVTGVYPVSHALESKRLALLHNLIPKGKAIAMLVYSGRATSELQLEEARNAAVALEREFQVLNAATPSEIDRAFATLTQSRVVG